MSPINQDNFESVRTLFLSNNIFIIPTFQRPYAWEDVHFDDLVSDIHKAALLSPPEHYLSPIHTIKVNSPNDIEWASYTDPSNEHIQSLAKSKFLNDDGGLLDVHMVVDGQQRLTTIYLLLSSLGKKFTEIVGGIQVPKIILGTANDHYGICKLLGIGGVPLPSAFSRGQRRLDAIYSKCMEDIKSFDFADKAVLQNGLKTLAITLSPKYGLRGFLTLNDRGKDLFQFEKLKSLMMEYDMTYGTKSNPSAVHKSFEKAYLSIESEYPSFNGKFSSLADDDRFLQMHALYIFQKSEILNEAPSKIFERYRKNAPDFATMHTQWVTSIEQISTQLSDLSDRLNGKFPDHLSKYHGVDGRSNEEHYKVVCDGLGLSPRSLAFLFKFRSTYPDVDWHTPVFFVNTDNGPALKLLEDAINQFIGDLETNSQLPNNDLQTLLSRVKSISSRIKGLQSTRSTSLSLLDLAEMIELFVVKSGSRKDYISTWSSAFPNIKINMNTAFEYWHAYATNYGARYSFFSKILGDNIGDSRDMAYYVLAEHESMLRSGTKCTTLPYQETFDVEHFLSHETGRAITSWPYCGFMHQDSYNKSCNQIGNLLLLDSSLNRALGDQPYHIKLSAYLSGFFAGTKETSHSLQQEQFVRSFSSTPDVFPMVIRLIGLEIAEFLLHRV